MSQIWNAWFAAYGENMNLEYQEFIQILSEDYREEENEKDEE